MKRMDEGGTAAGLIGLLLIISFSYPVSISGLIPEVFAHCCELGRAWAIQSQEECGPYPESYISTMLYGPDETLACTALVDACCVLLRRERQCVAGKETALVLNMCDGVHLYQANEDAKECCNCCQLGIITSRVGLPCHVPIQLSGSPPCVETFTECCYGQSPVIPGPDSVTPGPRVPPPTVTQSHLYTRFHSLPIPVTTTSATDINECEEFEGELCAHLCINTVDSYYCTCREGFVIQSDGKSCKQLSGPVDDEDKRRKEEEEREREKATDACRTGRHTCTANQRCVNTRNGYVCEEEDYDPEEEEEEEEEEEVTVTTATTRKRILPTSTQFPLGRCSQGYAWNRATRQCEDIDECILELHNCATGQSCVNTEGHFRCQTEVDDGDNYDDYYPETESPDSGYDDDDDIHGNMVNTTTLFPTTKRNDRLSTTHHRRHNGNHRLTTVWYPRRTPILNTVSAAPATGNRAMDEGSQCLTGYTLDNRRTQCVDVDECSSDVHNCRLPNQVCINSVGSYRCQCEDGYEFNQVSNFCEDIDECALLVSACARGQICENTLGSYLCTCEPGFSWNSVRHQCTDVNECEVASSCREGQVCRNTVGSFICNCQTGFTLDPQSQRCTDINECRITPNICSASEMCENVVGSYRCTRKIPACGPGYRLNPTGNRCIDVDECSLSSSHCARDQICENTVGSYVCKCSAGFSLDSRSQQCTDIDECAQQTTNYCSATETCENTIGTYRCTRKSMNCQPGYELHRSGNRCVDIDECATDESACGGSYQRCENTMGSYNCRCIPGYNMNATTQTCEDIDECQSRQVTCSRGQQCVNTAGSYECRCSSGYTQDTRTKTCIDIDECERRMANCSDDEICENTQGAFRCVQKPVVCLPGLTLAPSGKQCIDVDECQQNTHNCGNSRTCQNTHGSFRCVTKQCPRGRRLDSETGQCVPIVCARGMRLDYAGNCVDINECVERQDACRPHQECRNTIGSYQCHNTMTCGTGYELNTETGRCDDIDECQRGTHGCQGSLVQCINRPGTYLCQCPDGYQLDHLRQSCEDIDECRLYAGRTCSQNAECENTPGSFRCNCKEGFEETGDGRTCRDVDECQQPRLCQHTCKNTWGSFQCSCHNGYQLSSADGRSCQDINECAVWSQRGNLLCQGICENTPGSYRCTCPPGYQLASDGRICRDIDECAAGNSNCNGQDNICINTRGDYKCENIICPKGFDKVVSPHRNSHAVRCQRKSFVCPQGDAECLYAPLSYSVNFIAIPGKLIRVPTDLFTMRGPGPSGTSNRRLQFELKVLSAKDPRTGAVRVNRSFFNLNQVRTNEVVVQLIQQIQGAQDIQLQLNMNVYSRETTEEVFYGTAVAKIFIYITEDPW